MPEAAHLLDLLVTRLRAAAEYDGGHQVPPACVLWPDPEGQWAPLLPHLRERLTVWELGPYRPEAGRGPAIWLRTALAEQTPSGGTPILYLPGVRREDLRGEDAAPPLRPLVELQYRGATFANPEGRPWTVPGFLQNRERGLGLSVGQDAETRREVTGALPQLAELPLARLRALGPITASAVRQLLHPDLDGELLAWLEDEHDRGASFEAAVHERYGVHPRQDGPLAVVSGLATRQDAWQGPWARFAQNPQAHPTLVKRLEAVFPSGATDSAVWPQANLAAETRLRGQLNEVATLAPEEARERLLALDAEHGPRRTGVWAALGRSPLAQALAPLAALAQDSREPVGGGTAEVCARAYVERGWRVDAAALQALAAVRADDDVAAVGAALRGPYLDWLRRANAPLQVAVNGRGLPPSPSGHWTAGPGLAVLFVDGLRFDLAHTLAASLNDAWTWTLDWQWSALPSTTPTAKPAVAPHGGALQGGPDLHVKHGGKTVTAQVLRALLEERGFAPLEPGQVGDPGGSAWAESGDLDRLGHSFGVRMASRLPNELDHLRARIEGLLTAGYREVRIVTDHGWLLLPGGLPKADLPAHLVGWKKGRCALLKAGVESDFPVVPWTWDAGVDVTVAPELYAFEAGQEYEHGGVSLQECVVPVLTVRAATVATAATIHSVRWTRLRCRVQVEGPLGLQVDIRRKAGEAGSSVLGSLKTLDASGTASLLVPDDELVGHAAVIVVLDGGRVVAQQVTVIGGEA